jgi:hypothetical protein
VHSNKNDAHYDLCRYIVANVTRTHKKSSGIKNSYKFALVCEMSDDVTLLPVYQ